MTRAQQRAALVAQLDADIAAGICFEEIKAAFLTLFDQGRLAVSSGKSSQGEYGVVVTYLAS